MVGKVYLVGAGPGDPGLVTVRATEVLRLADVVLYDRLANPRLLDLYSRPEAWLTYVGKAPGQRHMTQEEINDLLVRRAQEGKIVVRLHGGDPFVFGRGGEEAEALAAAGIPFEVVPGVSSAVAVPAYAGIPVTHRGHNSSLTIVTGHEYPEKSVSTVPWDRLAAETGTLVVLMGMANLGPIARRLMGNGMSSSTPAAVIRWGTLPEQESVVGTLSDIEGRVAAAGLEPPAVIVIGSVVGIRKRLRWLDHSPLREAVVTANERIAANAS